MKSILKLFAITDEDPRNFERIEYQYAIEKDLALKLRNSRKEDRQYLYNHLYDRLFQQVSDHPQINRKNDPQASAREVAQKMQLLQNFLEPDSIFLEIGPGDCQLAIAVAKKVKKVYAVDVSQEIVKNPDLPANFALIVSDGCTVPVASNSVTIAYSNQLIEHLHPDDAIEQLRNIYKALAPGGSYLCLTPNKLSGPHDISKHFDEIATGFHLKEYTFTELSKLFEEVGFSKIKAYIGGQGVYLRFPVSVIKFSESIASLLSFKIRKKLRNNIIYQAILGIRIVGQK
jgi:SAM-dependent methyltransferase